MALIPQRRAPAAPANSVLANMQRLQPLLRAPTGVAGRPASPQLSPRALQALRATSGAARGRAPVGRAPAPVQSAPRPGRAPATPPPPAPVQPAQAQAAQNLARSQSSLTQSLTNPNLRR